MYIYNEVSGNTIQGSLDFRFNYYLFDHGITMYFDVTSINLLLNKYSKFEYRYLLVKKTCQCQLDLLKRVIHVIERTTDVYEITLIGKLVSEDK